jgi:hypothetical protein
LIIDPEIIDKGPKLLKRGEIGELCIYGARRFCWRLFEAPRDDCRKVSQHFIKFVVFVWSWGEIEAALAQQAGVGAVAVVLCTEKQIEQLTAFIVLDDE